MAAADTGCLFQFGQRILKVVDKTP